MNDKTPQQQPDNAPEEEVVYEEFAGAQNAPVRPQFGRFPPPPPLIIEEEIIEEIEDVPDAEQSSETGATAGNPELSNSAEAAAAPAPQNSDPRESRPARRGSAKPVLVDRKVVRQIPAKRINFSSYAKYPIAVCVLITCCWLAYGIFIALDNNMYAKILVGLEESPEPQEEESYASDSFIDVRLPSGAATMLVSQFYSQISNGGTLKNLRDILLQGTVKIENEPVEKTFYCIKRYDTGNFLKIGTNGAEKSYLLSNQTPAVFLLTENRVGGARERVEAKKAAFLRSIIEWDDAIFPTAFQLDSVNEKPTVPYFGVERNIERGGGKFAQLEIDDIATPKTKYLFDEKTKLMSEILITSGKSEIKIELSDYKKIDGAYKIPTLRKIYLDGKKIAEVKIGDVKINKGLFFPM